MISTLKARFRTINKVSGHNQYAAKACPGFNVPKWFTSTPDRITIPPAMQEIVGPKHGGIWAAIAAFFVNLIGGKK